ncbi:TetR/AcrR family transcriptional regulator [Nocardia sp. NPDC020380]|uniref:TetR/AcrR family transcriptional regulator n=1 Tax=Nocardia sp. NPDC020380 TaxID=3364309 RepID=UPI0037A35F96
MVNSRSPQQKRRGSPVMRAELIDAAIRLLEADGPQALQTRRVAAAAGVSTMAVYTHFGSMTELLAAVLAEIFARFGAALGAVAHTDDPVADFFALSVAYREFALADPRRYRLLFSFAAPEDDHSRSVCDFPAAEASGAIGAETFEYPVRAVERMMAAGRLGPGPARDMAARLWAFMHGALMLELNGYLGPEDHSRTTVFLPALIDILVGMGADRAHVERVVPH